MFPGLFFKISSNNISIHHVLKMKKSELLGKKSHEFHFSFSSQRVNNFVQQKHGKWYKKKHPDVYS